MATMLVVDDDAPSREFMRTLLTYRGHQIREAADGDTALTLITRRPPDAVITDVLMPGLDGYGLARELRSRPSTRDLPIVFSTAHYGPDEIRPLADACEVRDIIFKPAHPSTVLATIDALPIPRRPSVPAAERSAEIRRLTRSGTWELDLATKSVALSPQLREVLGLPVGRLALEELTMRVHPDDVAPVTTTAENTWRTGQPGLAEVRLVDGAGAVRELVVSCRVTASRVLWGAVQDVTGIRDEVRAQLRVQADWHAVRRTVDGFHRATLPWALPDVPGVGLAAVYVPAPERLDVGTAWYDARRLPGDRVLLSVGKVAAPDRPPAAVLAHTLAALRAYAHDDPDPAALLTRLNRFLTDTGEDDAFVTAVVALYTPATGELRIANGGHPYPLMVTADGTATLVASDGPAVGILPDVRYTEQVLHLADGAAFCAYTDGLIDRTCTPTPVDPNRLPRVAARIFGRLTAELTGQDPDRPPVTQLLAENIVRDMLAGAAPDDDVCFVVLHPDGC